MHMFCLDSGLGPPISPFKQMFKYQNETFRLHFAQSNGEFFLKSQNVPAEGTYHCYGDALEYKFGSSRVPNFSISAN
jgi:hypothetical protein